MPNTEFSFNNPFKEQLDYFRQKGYAISPNGWKDLWKDAHAKAFTVARVTQADVLVDIRKAADKAMAEGLSLDQFKKNLIPTLTEKGWFAPKGEKAIITLPDGTKQKRLTGWRVETIYRQNISTAYQTGRFKQMLETADRRPFWQYMTVFDPRVRESHRPLHGVIYDALNEFWASYYPPNGFRCRCYVKSLSESQLENRGLKVSSEVTPEMMKSADDGWDYNPAKAGVDAYKPVMTDYPAMVRNYLEKEITRLPAVIKTAEATAAVAAVTVGDTAVIQTSLQAEKAFKFATDGLATERTHRIDQLWDSVSAQMTREEFEKWIAELARDGKIELLGGNTSAMTIDQIQKLIKDQSGMTSFFVNMIWTN
ncbi:MAG: hypothetical protein EHM87_17820 [Burkholderiales bacterium]|nr:MAG: hypothetical protein EHM87_17820 [Burkholderiales bacterium]